MRIAFFSNCYLPYLSGVTLSIKTLADDLRTLGHTVFIVGPNYPGNQTTDPFILRYPSLPAPYPGYRIVIPFSPAVLNRLRNEKVELAHVHQPFEVGLAARSFAKGCGVPLVYTFHTLFTRYVHHLPLVPDQLSKAALAAYLTFFCNQTDAVVAPSTMVKRYLRTLGVKRRIEVIPTGVPISQVTCHLSLVACRQKLNLPSNGKILLYSGRLSAEKNIPFLLQTFPKILAEVKDVYLVLVGGGPKEQEYRRLAGERIIFTGQVKHPEIYEYYRAADLFVYASLTETQGLVLSEAKAGGLPIVALFAGGLADVVNNGRDGYLVARNESAFVQRVVQLLRDDSLRRVMGEKARVDARERFSSIVVAKRMETLYNSLNKRGGH